MGTRKRGWWVLGGVVALAGTAALPAAAAPRVIVNGEMLQGVRVYTMGGHAMVPVREVIERIPGASVQWVPERLEMIVSDRGERIVLHTGSGIATVGGRGVSLDAPVAMRQGRAYMPARFVERVLGAKVDYDRATQLVSITAGLSEARTAGYRAAPPPDESASPRSEVHGNTATDGANSFKYDATGTVAIGGEDVITFLHPGIYKTTKERARRVTELLNDGLAQIAPQGGGRFSVNGAYLGQAKGNPVIMMGTIAVVSVTPDDAKKHKTTQKALANKWLKRIRLALADIYGNAGANR